MVALNVTVALPSVVDFVHANSAPVYVARAFSRITVSAPVPLALLKLGSELVKVALTPVAPGACSTCALTAANNVPVLGAVTVPAAPVTVNVTVPVAPIVMLLGRLLHEPSPT